MSTHRSSIRSRRLAVWCGLVPVVLLLGCDSKSESNTDSLTNDTSPSSTLSVDSSANESARPSDGSATSESPTQGTGSGDTDRDGVSRPHSSDSVGSVASGSEPASSDQTADPGVDTSARDGESDTNTDVHETSFTSTGSSSGGSAPSDGSAQVGNSSDVDSAQTSSPSSELSSPAASTSAPESEPPADSTSDVDFPEGTPLVMVMVDASSGVFSRLFYWGGSEGFAEFPDAWEATRAALSQLAGETNARFWPVLYRAERDGACPNLNGSEDQPLANNAELADWLPPSSEAVGETKQEGPLADALEVALDKLLNYEHAGPKHLLLISDGPPGDSCTYFDAPDCNRDPVFGLVQNAYAAGIRTRMLNLGLDTGLEFAEDVSHAGNGEPVIALYQKVYCIAQEAVHRGEIASNDYDALNDYVTNWRQHAKGEYLPDGEVYSQVLSYSPTDAATLAAAVQSYVQWVTQTP